MPSIFSRDTTVTNVAITIPQGTPAQQVIVDGVTCGVTMPAASLPVDVVVDATVILNDGTAQTQFMIYGQKVVQTTASKKDGFTLWYPGGIKIGDKGSNTAVIRVLFGATVASIDFGVNFHYE